MNAFAENPFFFFVDNMPPIPVNPPKNARRIVELSDTGCDARLSVSALLRNATRYYSAKSAKMKSSGNWRPRCEEMFEGMHRGDRFRGRNEQKAVNAEGLYFVPKETENGQNYWQGYSPYENVNNEAEYERKPENRDCRMNSRITPERIRHWRQGNNDRYEQSVPKYNSNVSRNNAPFQSSFVKSKLNMNQSQLPHFNYTRDNAGNYNQEIFYNRERRRAADQDYPKSFEEFIRDSRNRRDYNENVMDDGSYQGHSPSKQSSKYWKEAINYKPRLGSRSPSSDRRKRTQPINKTIYENAESQYDIKAFQDSANMTSNAEGSLNPSSSSEKFKQSVDRAVDKDSLSDVPDESASKEQLTATESKMVNDEGKKSRKSFWEFISLEDEDEKKPNKGSVNRKSIWPFKQKTESNSTLKDKYLTKSGIINLKTKRKIDQTGILEPQDSNIKNIFPDSDSHVKLSNEEEEVTVVKLQEISEALENLENPDKAQNVVEKRPSRFSKFGFNTDKKKKMADNEAIDAVSNNMEGPVTKRTFEKSKMEEFTNDFRRESTFSRLPIRIGPRRRSKNPIPLRFRTSLKGYVFSNEENKDTTELHEEADDQQNLARSRTKPKVKSTLLQQEDVLNFVEVIKQPKSMENVQQIAENNGCSRGNEKGDENLIKSNVNDELIDVTDGKLLENEKLRSGVDNKIENMTGDQRINQTGSARVRESIRRSNLTKGPNISRDNLKETCFFNMHTEENVVCNGYCNKDCRKLKCLHSRKLTTLKSRL